MGQLSNLGVSNDEMEPKIEIYMKKNKQNRSFPKSNFKKIKWVHSPRLYLIENISCAYSILIFVIAKRT